MQRVTHQSNVAAWSIQTSIYDTITCKRHIWSSSLYDARDQASGSSQLVRSNTIMVGFASGISLEALKGKQGRRGAPSKSEKLLAEAAKIQSASGDGINLNPQLPTAADLEVLDSHDPHVLAANPGSKLHHGIEKVLDPARRFLASCRAGSAISMIDRITRKARYIGGRKVEIRQMHPPTWEAKGYTLKHKDIDLDDLPSVFDQMVSTVAAASYPALTP
jgi:hypothetical protein